MTLHCIARGYGDVITVPHQSNNDHPLRVLTFAWWVVFLVLGLFCEETFRFLREAGHVSRLNDLVGSPVMITFGWALFLGFFAAGRCRESGMAPFDARVRGMEVSILAGAAFFPYPLEIVFLLQRIPSVSTQAGIVAIAVVKLGAFLYIFYLLARYYLGDAANSFMPRFSPEESVLPDAKLGGESGQELGSGRPRRAGEEAACESNNP